MEKLFSDIFSAETCKFGLIWAPYETLINHFDNDFKRIGISDYTTCRGINACENPIPTWMGNDDYKFPKYIRLVNLEAMPSACIYFCNLSDAWDSMIYNTSRLLHCRAIYINSLPVSIGKEFYFQQIEVLNNGETERILQAYFDNKPIFWDKGTPYPFENEGIYKNRFLKKRLNRDIIKDIFVNLTETIEFGEVSYNFVDWIFEEQNK